MIVSSVYHWMQQIRQTVEPYDPHILDQRRFCKAAQHHANEENAMKAETRKPPDSPKTNTLRKKIAFHFQLSFKDTRNEPDGPEIQKAGKKNLKSYKSMDSLHDYDKNKPTKMNQPYAEELKQKIETLPVPQARTEKKQVHYENVKLKRKSVSAKQVSFTEFLNEDPGLLSREQVNYISSYPKLNVNHLTKKEIDTLKRRKDDGEDDIQLRDRTARIEWSAGLRNAGDNWDPPKVALAKGLSLDSIFHAVQREDVSPRASLNMQRTALKTIPELPVRYGDERMISTCFEEPDVFGEEPQKKNTRHDLMERQKRASLQPNTLPSTSNEPTSDKKKDKKHEKSPKTALKQSKSSDILLRLFKRRSSRADLESKGILRNEPIFGNTLDSLARSSGRPVPDFVCRSIELIEDGKNIYSEGLYRTSGNLATIQKIRFKVDSDKLGVLDEHRGDCDVLAGALKLFFRELQESLIGRRQFLELVKILRTSTNEQDSKKRHVHEVLSSLSPAHHATLRVLIAHLLKVVQHEAHNHMSISVLSICWGPSLICFEDNDTKDQMDGAMELAQSKNQVIELILETFQQSSTGDKFRMSDSLGKFGQKMTDWYATRKHMSVMPRIDSTGSATTIDERFAPTQKLIDSIHERCKQQPARILELYDFAKFKPNEKVVMKILDKFEKGENSKQLPVLLKEKATMSELGNCLFEYFNRSETNLLPDGMFSTFIKSNGDEEVVRSELQKLDEDQLGLLRILMCHLSFVYSATSKDELMLFYIKRTWTPYFTGSDFKTSNYDVAVKCFERMLKLFDVVRTSYL